MPLHHIVYFADVNCDLGSEIARIREASERNNSRTEVTGTLIYSDRSFLQVIEGRRAAANRIFRQICNDPRQKNLTVVQSADIDARAMPDCSMNFIRFGDVDPSIRKLFFPDHDIDLRRLKGSTLWDLIETSTNSAMRISSRSAVDRPPSG